MRQALTEQLDQLAGMSAGELAEEWERTYRTPAAGLSAELLQLGIAWRLQERRLGGLSRDARYALRKTAGGRKTVSKPRRKLTPGTRLVRDWHGTGHTVMVLAKGFEYDGKTWLSLTAIAKAITGTHWNGPRFFGLTGAAS